MSADVFVDTNVLIYAHDSQAGYKQTRAVDLLTELWETRRGALSTQVLQEFYVNVTRRIPVPLSPQTAGDIVERYEPWIFAPSDHELLMQAIRVERSARISFWDAMIVAAAQRSGSGLLMTEDLNHGQTIGSVTIQNPFA